MKNAKKIVMGGVAALALVTASVMGTMAYFTSKTEAVNNIFTVGKVEITLDETKTNELGEFLKKTDKKDASGNDIYTVVSSKDEADRTKTNDYKMIPGHTYQKDPTITVKSNSEDCYLFVKVEDGLADVEGDDTVAKQILTNWTAVAGETGVYYYGKNSMNTVKADDKVTLFETVTISKNATDTTLKNVKNKNITVKAYAVQAEGIDATDITTAWNAVRD